MKYNEKRVNFMKCYKTKNLFVMAGLLALLLSFVPAGAAAEEETPGAERIEKAIQVLREFAPFQSVPF